MKYSSFFIGTILAFALLNFSAHAALPEVPEDPQAVQLWKDKREASIRELQTKPKSEMIVGLSGMLQQLKTLNYRESPVRDEITTAVQNALLSIPDHANYFTDKIEESWESNAERVRLFESQPEWKAALEKAEQASEASEGMFNLIGGMWGDYGGICSENLGMLGHIPSTESVRALGHYLRERDEPGIKIHSRGTGFVAAESLTELISDGPMRTWQASWEDVPKWQKWFDEVKAGKRSFRFVGSDVDYTLDGPADAGTLKRIRNKDSSRQDSCRRRKHAIAAEEQARPNKMGPVLHGGLIAAILLCLGALAFLLKRRNVA